MKRTTQLVLVHFPTVQQVCNNIQVTIFDCQTKRSIATLQKMVEHTQLNYTLTTSSLSIIIKCWTILK